MRKFLFPYCLLLICSVSYGQYTWINPKPSGFNNTKVHFISADTGFVLNTNGDLLKTSNAGQSWARVYGVSSPACMSIQGRTILIAPTSSAIRVSQDAGKTWTTKSRPNPADAVDLCQVISTDTFFLVSKNSGKIMRTYDGGNSWQTFNAGRPITSMYFLNSRVGYIGAASFYILKTVDGGATWQTSFYQPVIPSKINFIYFVDENKGFAFREYYTFMKTIDGGVTWTTENFSNQMFSMYFVNSSVGYMCGEYAKAFRTGDGGNTWQPVHPNNYYYLGTDVLSTFFTDEDHGYSVGMRGIIHKTSNGGATWQQYGAHYNGFTDVDFATDSLAYASSGNDLLKSTDGGNSWQPLTNSLIFQPAPYGLIHFFSRDTGIVTAGEYQGWIFKTYDGGSTWKWVHGVNVGSNYIRSLDFVNNQVGYHVVGAQSFAHSRTVDGGETWQVVNQYSNVSKVEFIDAATGYGWTFKDLYKTIDSGKTWTLLSTEGFDIKSIHFTSLKNGFMVGDMGLAKKTTDSGKTWTTMQFPGPVQQYADHVTIKFYDEKTGFLSSENGFILKTSDSGKTWVYSGYVPQQYRIIKYRNAVAYIGGEYGGLVRFNLTNVFVGALGYSNLTDSSIDVSALVTALYATADSIRFEYGVAPTMDKWIAATPASITDQELRVTASIRNLQPNTQYYWLAKIYVNGSYIINGPVAFTTPVKYVVAPGIPGSCESYAPVNVSSANNNQWVSLKDAYGNAVADINANGNDLGNVTASVFIENGPVRNTSGFYFLDRNISIQVQNQPVTPVSIRLYITKAEYDELSQIAAAGIGNINMLKIHKNSTGCSGNIEGGLTELVTTAAPWGNDYVLTAQVNSFSSFYFSKPGGALPVRLVNFNANRNNRQVALGWQTMAENNTSYFEILRSRDGINFETIGKVMAAGQSNSLHNYSFNDNSPADGSNYYKLKIVDNDQRVDYSRVVRIDMQSATTAALLQNPVKDFVVLNGGSERFTEIQVIDVQGRLVKKFVPAVTNVYSVQGLLPGVYYLRCVSGRESVMLKFVKK